MFAVVYTFYSQILTLFVCNQMALKLEIANFDYIKRSRGHVILLKRF